MTRSIKVGDWVRIIGKGTSVHQVAAVEVDSAVVDDSWENFESLTVVSDFQLRVVAKSKRLQAKKLIEEADEIDTWLKSKEKA